MARTTRPHFNQSGSTETPTASGTTPEFASAYASFMIAAGINAKALSSFMGHASITVTFDLYGHLMPGSEAEGAALLDAYLDGRSKDTEETDE